MFGLGTSEILLVILVILLLFGAKKIPEMMRGMGQGLREFKKAASEATDDIKKAVEDTDNEPPKSDKV
ncbi:MAG: twin-arginine translocase TatA/TatE family subunit [Armatimonadia bacterium]